MLTMSAIRIVTPQFAAAPQLTQADVAAAAAAGYRTLIANRPDGEAPDQPSLAEIEAAAKDAGLDFHALPFQGFPQPGTVSAMAGVLTGARGPVLAYCKTGTRSIMAWAAVQALTGERTPGEVLALAARAGYDLSGIKGMLEGLAPA
jgi:uncharacterized protein (TIGR01244 family)